MVFGKKVVKKGEKYTLINSHRESEIEKISSVRYVCKQDLSGGIDESGREWYTFYKIRDDRHYPILRVRIPAESFTHIENRIAKTGGEIVSTIVEAARDGKTGSKVMEDWLREIKYQELGIFLR